MPASGVSVAASGRVIVPLVRSRFAHVIVTPSSDSAAGDCEPLTVRLSTGYGRRTRLVAVSVSTGDSAAGVQVVPAAASVRAS